MSVFFKNRKVEMVFIHNTWKNGIALGLQLCDFYVLCHKGEHFIDTNDEDV